ncbi:endogenous retrovirus group V member 2 Env polyprotein-like [Podarcis muralis]
MQLPAETFVGNHSGCASLYNRTHNVTSPHTLPWTTPGWTRGWFWLCGHTAYKTLPRNWYGTCSLGTVNPGLTIHDTLPGRRHSRYHRSWYSLAENPLEVRADALTTLQQEVAQMAQIANLTAEALLALQIEIRQTATITLQNRMALDYLLASQGGVCTLLNTSCCVYINQDQRVVTNIEQIRKLATIYNHSDRVESNVDRIKKQADLYHKISLAGGELPSMWNWLTSWLPGWGWLKEILLVILFLFLTLLLLSCLLPCLIQLVRRMVSRSVDAATRTHVLALYDIELIGPSNENEEP